MTHQTTVKNSKRLLLATATAIATLTAAPGASTPGQRGKHDAAVHDLLQSGGAGRVRVIVRAAPGQRDALRDHLRGVSQNAIQAEHRFIDAFTVELPLPAVAALESRPFVASISLDAPMKSHQIATGGTAYVLRPTLGLDTKLDPKLPQGAGVT